MEQLHRHGGFRPSNSSCILVRQQYRLGRESFFYSSFYPKAYIVWSAISGTIRSESQRAKKANDLISPRRYAVWAVWLESQGYGYDGAYGSRPFLATSERMFTAAGAFIGHIFERDRWRTYPIFCLVKLRCKPFPWQDPPSRTSRTLPLSHDHYR